MATYTKTGDNGTSAVCSDQRLPKSALLFDVLGTLDELNVCLGFVASSELSEVSTTVSMLQQDFFDIGSLLAKSSSQATLLEKFDKRVLKFEELIDNLDTSLPRLTSFILPRGALDACYLQQSRVVCRRFERLLTRFFLKEDYSEDIVHVLQKYFNRLSDLLFILARYVNFKEGLGDVL